LDFILLDELGYLLSAQSGGELCSTCSAGSTPDRGTDHTIGSPPTAAETGKRSDMAAETDAIKHLPRDRRLL